MPEGAGDLVEVGQPVSVMWSDAARRAAGLLTVVAVDVQLAVRVATASATVERNQRVRRFLQSMVVAAADAEELVACLLYTSPSPRDRTRSRMPSSA